MFGDDRSICRLSPAARTRKLVEKFVTKLVCEVKKNCAEAELFRRGTSFLLSVHNYRNQLTVVTQMVIHVLMPPPLQIPVVTPEDLYDFHARAFGFPAPKQQFLTSEESCNGAAYEEAFQLEDDDLGYYPDGVKRTLTDDQIAMFRHSEIYSILRARQVRRENLEAEGGEQSMGLDAQPEEDVKAMVFLDEEGEVKSDGEVEEPLATVRDTTPQRVEYTQARKKRKRGDADVGYVHGRKQVSRSARGFVRELDSAAAENQILDYGDDTSAVEGSKENEFTTTQVAEQDRESRAHPAEGRKFWWPVIEAT